MDRLTVIWTVATGLASVAALCLTFYWIGRRRSRQVERPRRNVHPAAEAVDQFVRGILTTEPADIDIIGYSVHALLDAAQPAVSRALKAGRRVRVLMLSTRSRALLEKSALEREHHTIDLAKLRERNFNQIERTCQRLETLADDIRYQSNIGHVRLEIRLYDQFPLYRGLLSQSGPAVVGSYLIDPSCPGRELDHVFLSNGMNANDPSSREFSAFRQWYEYLWQTRSRPFGVDCILFDLYDTLITIPAEARRASRQEMARIIQIRESEFENFWEATREASNKGEISSTEARFRRILELSGKPVRVDLCQQLASIEHATLSAHASYCPSALETLGALRAKGYQLAVSTNCSRSAFSAINSTRIASHLDLLFLSFENGFLKPSAQMYENPLRVLGIEPSRCVFVGDGANNEIEGARRVGLNSVLVASANGGNQRADFMIRNLSELPTALERIAASMAQSKTVT